MAWKSWFRAVQRTVNLNKRAVSQGVLRGLPLKSGSVLPIRHRPTTRSTQAPPPALRSKKRRRRPRLQRSKERSVRRCSSPAERRIQRAGPRRATGFDSDSVLPKPRQPGQRWKPRQRAQRVSLPARVAEASRRRVPARLVRTPGSTMRVALRNRNRQRPSGYRPDAAAFTLARAVGPPARRAQNSRRSVVGGLCRFFGSHNPTGYHYCVKPGGAEGEGAPHVAVEVDGSKGNGGATSR